MHLVGAPRLRQRLALHHQVDRAARLALHDRVSAAQRLLHDDAGRQRPFPFDVGPHQAALVERLLHEMHIGVARALELAARRERRLAGHQQHRDAAAEQVVHRGRGIGGADVDVHQHALAAPGHECVTGRHVGGGILVRAADDAGQRFAAAAPMRDLLDDRRMIGAEIAEQVVDPDFAQSLQEKVRRREIRLVGLRSRNGVHEASVSWHGVQLWRGKFGNRQRRCRPWPHPIDRYRRLQEPIGTTSRGPALPLTQPNRMLTVPC